MLLNTNQIAKRRKSKRRTSMSQFDDIALKIITFEHSILQAFAMKNINIEFKSEVPSFNVLKNVVFYIIFKCF